ncbi:UNVERIFIED_CONTAM: hypothetical protein Sangu_1445500 [Sesamum angustifolium]|uniref:Uncharacterized protein n=1 Tax=Sesamum angustifolium TaxID=2727405 RepID=A0AAW2N8N6_9LAMI
MAKSGHGVWSRRYWILDRLFVILASSLSVEAKRIVRETVQCARDDHKDIHHGDMTVLRY